MSTFAPTSLRAAGLLLLRLAVAWPLAAAALDAPGWLAVLWWSGTALLLLGLLTPLAALVAAVHAALALLHSGTPLQALPLLLAALALVLARGGRFSLDARLFGPMLVMAWPETRSRTASNE